MRVQSTSVVPNLKECTAVGGSTVLPEVPSIATRGQVSDATVDLVQNLFETEVSIRPVIDDADELGFVVLEQTKKTDGERSEPGEYHVVIDESGAEVSAHDDTGLQYGVQTILGLLTERGEKYFLPWCDIRDWPDHEWRGMLADPARGFIPPDRLEALIDKMARAKMNRLHLHLTDAEAHTIESESYPELAGGFDEDVPEFRYLQTNTKRTEYYSVEDIKSLIDYAERRHVEIIPEIDIPGHATQVLTNYPELRCEVDSGDSSLWSMCIGSEQTYDFIATILSEVAELFPTDVIHIGTDEWEFDVSWSECERCQQRMEREGLNTIHELFTYFLKRVHDIITGHDREMMIWNETVDRSGLAEIPEDILIQFWRYTPQDWDDIDGCTLEDYLEEGHDVVNSYVPAAYIDRHTTEEYLLGWHPTLRPTIPEEYEDQILGGEMTAWSGWEDEGWREFYQRSLPSAIPAFGNQVWDATAVEDSQALYSAVERHVLGPSLSDELDLYGELGGVVLPVDSDQNQKRADFPSSIDGRSIAGAVADYECSKNRLQSHLDEGDPLQPDAVEAYVDCFEWLAEVANDDGSGIFEQFS